MEEKEVPSNMLEVDVTEAESVLPPDILYMLKSIKYALLLLSLLLFNAANSYYEIAK